MCKVVHNLTIINYIDIASDENVNPIISKLFDISPPIPYTLCHAKVYQHQVRICNYHRYISHVFIRLYFFKYSTIWKFTRHYHKIYTPYLTDMVKCMTCCHRDYCITTLSFKNHKNHQFTWYTYHYQHYDC